MAYIIAEPCIGTKDTACVLACPVDCIYEYDAASKKLVVKGKDGMITKEVEPNPNLAPADLEKQLFIQPEECIDCNACVDPCPVDAIFSDYELPERWQSYADINKNAFADLAS